MAFLLGYYCHLRVDQLFLMFVRDEGCIKDMFWRLKAKPLRYERIKGQPETFETVKKAFGKGDIFLDIAVQEQIYLQKHGPGAYRKILPQLDTFNNYIDYMPEGAIGRKVKIMCGQEVLAEDSQYDFFTEEEIRDFVDQCCRVLYEDLSAKSMQGYQ